MKKIILLVITATVLISCGTSKVVRQSKKAMKGNWTLNQITYSEQGKFNVTLLNDVSKECFEGSTWKFISNNNTGNYTINGSNCNGGERYFVFTVQEVDANTGLYDFLLKPTNIKGKSDLNTGFRLKLSELTEGTMQWQQTIYLEGKPFVISMNFTKNLTE